MSAARLCSYNLLKCLVPCSVQLLRMFDSDYFKKLTKFGRSRVNLNMLLTCQTDPPDIILCRVTGRRPLSVMASGRGSPPLQDHRAPSPPRRAPRPLRRSETIANRDERWGGGSNADDLGFDTTNFLNK